MPGVRLHCVECGRDFTDLASYQAHVHADPVAVGWGCILLLIIGLAAFVFVIIAWTGASF